MGFRLTYLRLTLNNPASHGHFHEQFDFEYLLQVMQDKNYYCHKYSFKYLLWNGAVCRVYSIELHPKFHSPLSSFSRLNFANYLFFVYNYKMIGHISALFLADVCMSTRQSKYSKSSMTLTFIVKVNHFEKLH